VKAVKFAVWLMLTVPTTNMHGFVSVPVHFGPLQLVNV
jgi:hypothetical protein